MRESELIGLRWEQVDLEAGTIAVSRQITRTNKGTLVEGDVKTENSKRTIPLTSMSLAALKIWRRQLLEERLALGSGWTENGLVWPSQVGTPLGHRNLLRHLHRTCERINEDACDCEGTCTTVHFRRVSFHTLRHSAATIMLAARVDSRLIMDQLGHVDPRMVVRYQHVNQELQRGVADAVEQAWSAPVTAESPSESPSNEGPRTGDVPNSGS